MLDQISEYYSAQANYATRTIANSELYKLSLTTTKERKRRVTLRAKLITKPILVIC